MSVGTLRVATAAVSYFLVQSLASTAFAQAAAAPAGEAPVATAPEQVGEIVVFGRGEAKIGIAQAASEGTIAGSDLLVRPLLRVAELLEAVPGMVAAQHSGSGKANQYFLRGVNLDHGSDFTTYIDDVQMNFRTHGHGQGYLDLNGLIPEIVNREDYRKGPYRADGGDFALTGAAYMQTIQEVERPWISTEIGTYGWRRLAGGGTARDVGGGDLTFVGQAKVYDGPWQQPERLRHVSAFLKYSKPTSLGRLDLSTQVYRGTWRPTEQIPDRIVGSAVCPDVFCSPDPTARGETTRIIANAKLTGQGWRGNLYGQYYDWTMFSNPTYANPDGSNAQIKQFDKRWIAGLKAQKTWELTPSIEFVAGTENRLDHIQSLGVFHTINRVFDSSFGDHHVTEASASGYGEITWRATDRLRFIGGLRGDFYHYNVKANDPPAVVSGVGSGSDGLLSPKATAAYKLTGNVELYASWGRGFHSNDVRGAVATPAVPVLVAGTGKEIGARFQLPHFSLTTTYWWLDIGSELRFVGDSNAVEPTGASSRHGYEIVAFWRPTTWLAIDANYTGSRSRYDNGDYIPNAFKNAAQVGVSLVSDHWEGSVRMRHLGAYPLIEDNSERAKGSTVINTRGAYKMAHVELYAELLNVFNSRDKDITYFYESYIPRFDAAPVEGTLSRVLEPRTFRVGATYKF